MMSLISLINRTSSRNDVAVIRDDLVYIIIAIKKLDFPNFFYCVADVAKYCGEKYWMKENQQALFFLSDCSVENEPSIFISQEKCKNKQSSRAS